jgi:hypothetical protein
VLFRPAKAWLRSPLKVGATIVAIGLPLELARFFLGNPIWVYYVIVPFLYVSMSAFFFSLWQSQNGTEKNSK